MARSLHDLTKQENHYHWKEAQQVAFNILKLHFTTAPILAFPDIDCKFCLKSNASNYTTGAVPSIEKEGVWHPVAFSSHSMMPQKWNYPITDKEMLLIIQALEQWCHYLEGARHQFKYVMTMWICNGSCKGRTLINNKHAGHNTYLDFMWSGITTWTFYGKTWCTL